MLKMGNIYSKIRHVETVSCCVKTIFSNENIFSSKKVCLIRIKEKKMDIGKSTFFFVSVNIKFKIDIYNMLLRGFGVFSIKSYFPSYLYLLLNFKHIYVVYETLNLEL